MPDAALVEPELDEIAERRRARAQHQVGGGRQRSRPALITRPWAVKRSGVRTNATSCTVTMRGLGRGRDRNRRVADVDAPRRPLDRRPLEAVPRLVQPRPSERQIARTVGGRNAGRVGGDAGRRRRSAPRPAGPARRRATWSAATAEPPGTSCQHCSSVYATRSGMDTATSCRPVVDDTGSHGGFACAAASEAIVSWALSPLGLGTIQSSAPSNAPAGGRVWPWHRRRRNGMR